MKKKIILSVLGAVLLMCFLAACQTAGSAGASMAGTSAETGGVSVSESISERAGETGASRTAEENDASAYTADTPISDIIQDPVFGDYGRLIFPVNSSYYRGDTLGELSLTWYSHIDPEKTVEIANYMREHAAAGETIFYDIYTEEEKAQDPAKEDTGLFFFRGNPGAKFAVCNAGGGFAYVGAMHDSFPHALELSKMGCNAFALIYRPGAQTACEDLARAIAFIFGHAEELQVDTADYSLWGGSAGGRMAAWLGSYGTAAFGEEALPRPAAVIMQYTGYSEYSENDPPTYACVGDQDGIASWRTMEERLNRLQEFGTDTEFHVYPGLGHGFGLGTGTVAEGWLQDAVSFWEKHMENPPENASPDSGLEQGLQAVEEAMAAGSRNASEPAEGGEDLRQGTSENTIGTPEDFPAAYDYGSGRMEDWSRADMMRKMPLPQDGATVRDAVPDPAKIQAFYLWEEGNVPAVTEFTQDMTGYFDNWDFRPYVTAIPVREGTEPKGAVVLMAGGAYQFRGNYTDSLPTAAALREYGFQTFIVDYRLHPYTQEEGALDVARAVRFIRKNADIYGIDPEDIAVMGFSAGGIQAGEFLMHYDEDVNGTALDASYAPDELDALPAHASAAGMIYSFYGRLSVGNMDPEWLREGDLPPTFYVYGTEDPFYRQFEQQYGVIRDMGIPTGRIVLNNWPHGFGADGGWVEDYGRWLEEAFANQL